MKTGNSHRTDARKAGTATERGRSESLWTFAVSLYGKPGVAEVCLTLQDRLELDVPLLLFGAWVGAEFGLALTADEVARASAGVADWHAEVVRPLRQVRRRLKTGPEPAPSAVTESLRNALKKVELDAERIELQRLAEALAPSVPGRATSRSEAVRRNLAAVVMLYTRDVASDVVAMLDTIAAAALLSR